MKKRIEFVLSMPGKASWNGKWSGEGRHYAVVRTVSEGTAAKLLAVGSWSHRWDDGWCASVFARLITPGERLKKSAGFYGYEWMVDNIIAHGTTRHAQAEEAAL